MNTDNEDPIPRELMALVVLHGLLSGKTSQLVHFSDDIVYGWTQVAFAFADAMKQRGEK